MDTLDGITAYITWRFMSWHCFRVNLCRNTVQLAGYINVRVGLVIGLESSAIILYMSWIIDVLFVIDIWCSKNSNTC